MKPYLLFILFLLSVAACRKDPDARMKKVYRTNEKKVTIKQGVWGTIAFLEGNFMPGNTGNIYPVQRTVCIYEPAADSQFYYHDNLQGTPFFDSIGSRLIEKIESDNNGFFQAELPTGTYTMVVIEDGIYFANLWSGYYLNPFMTDSGKATKADFYVDYKAVY